MATREHALYCFAVLETYLEKKPAPLATFADEEYPLFVTWTRLDGTLRGCIGTFAAISLRDGLREYALTAAVRDSRFPPISRAELPGLRCAVSLLVNFEKQRDRRDWTVGKDGVWIRFPLDGRHETATFLPEVAAEQGWTRDETMEHLLRKGGYRGGRIPSSLLEAIELTTYQSSKVSVTFNEYLKSLDEE